MAAGRFFCGRTAHCPFYVVQRVGMSTISVAYYSSFNKSATVRVGSFVYAND